MFWIREGYLQENFVGFWFSASGLMYGVDECHVGNDMGCYLGMTGGWTTGVLRVGYKIGYFCLFGSAWISSF